MGDGAFLKTAIFEAGVFCLYGVGSGCGICFFMFLRLGLPKPTEIAGYVTGLFVVAGLEFGLAAFCGWRIVSRLVPQTKDWAAAFFQRREGHPSSGQDFLSKD